MVVSKDEFPDPIVNELRAAKVEIENWENVAATLLQQYGFEKLFDRDRCFALMQYIRSNKPRHQVVS